MTTDETTAIVVSSPLDLIEALDDSQIITALTNASNAAVKTWAYQFRQDGQDIIGMSIDGVQEAAREMAKRGDVIDQTEVNLDRETDREAFFTARAVRYAVSPDGRRVQMDSAIRSKRIEKFTKLREPKVVNGVRITEVFNRYWYEVGVAKAARNAVEALLPEGIKQWMMETAKKGGNVRDVSQEKRQAAQHRTGTDSAPAPSNPKQEAANLIKQAYAREDADAIKQELIGLFPSIFDDTGRAVLSEATVAQAREIAQFLTTRIAGQAAFVDA